MSEENMNLNTADTAKVEKKAKTSPKKPNIFSRAWKRICKFFGDVKGEMKKVVWTPKDELSKNTKLVLVTIVVVAAAIAVVDVLFSWIINSVAGFIG